MNTVTLQFSTTQWHLPGKGFFHVLKLMQLRWANRWSWLIRKFCHSQFSHVDFVLPDGTLLGASDSGVAIRPSDYQVFGYRRRMVIATDKADAIIAWAQSQIPKPFDSGGLKAFLSSKWPGARDWRDPNKWFCAELAVCAFEHGGYWPEPLLWPKNRVTPSDLLLLFVTDPNFVNRDTFWEPIPSLTLDPGEV